MAPVRTRIRQEFYADIIVCAVEGGINYWAFTDEYDYLPEKARVLVASKDNIVALGASEEGIWKEVTPDVLAQGFSKVRNDASLKINKGLRRTLLTAYDECDAGDIDAEGADVLVQIALFGEIVYGG